MTLTQLEYVLAVAQHRHFGKAADACHVAQPSLSTQIQKLEDELQVRIFERTRTSCAVTEVGQKVVEQARLILQESRRMEDIVMSFRTEVQGHLKLGVIPTIAPFLLPSLLPEIQESLPRLKLEIFEQKTADLVQMIEQGELDAAILSTPKTAPESLKEKVLYYEPFVLFASRSHPLRKSSTLLLSDLQHYPPLLLDDTHCMRDQVEKLCQSSQLNTSNIQIKTGTLQTLIEIVSTSGGYTLLPSSAQEFFRKTNPQAFVEFKDPKPARKVSLVFHKSFLKRPLIEALFQLITSHLPKGLLPVSQRSHAQVIDPQKERFQID